MRNILASTFGAFMLGVAIVSAQAPAGGQGQSGQTPTGAGTQPSTDRSAETRQSPMRPGSSQTYTGCLSSSSGGGYTLTNIQSESGSSGTNTRAGSSTTSSASSGANVPSGSSETTYRVMGGSSKADLSGMVGKRVEIVGTLSPENEATASSSTGAATAGAGAPAAGAAGPGRTGQTTAGGNTSAGANTSGSSAGAHSGMSSSGANRTLTITSVKTVSGTCSQ